MKAVYKLFRVEGLGFRLGVFRVLGLGGFTVKVLAFRKP